MPASAIVAAVLAWSAHRGPDLAGGRLIIALGILAVPFLLLYVIVPDEWSRYAFSGATPFQLPIGMGIVIVIFAMRRMWRDS
jgi:hypothetical protein